MQYALLIYADEESGIRASDLFTSFPRVLAVGLARRMRASLEPRSGPQRWLSSAY